MADEAPPSEFQRRLAGDREREAALAIAQAEREMLASAFMTVFGRTSQRTDEQRRVLAHLATCAGDDGNSYRFNEAKDGLALVAAGLHRDGAKSMLRIIERQVHIAEEIDATAQATAKLKKKGGRIPKA